MCNTKRSSNVTANSTIFNDPRQALIFFEKKRWGHKTKNGDWCYRPICPYCHVRRHVRMSIRSKRMFKCYSCKRRFSGRKGTFMENSKVKPNKWLQVIHGMFTSRQGISAAALAEYLEMRRETVWSMMQRIRSACKQDKELIKGVGCVDGVYPGGLEKNKHAHKRLDPRGGSQGKELVVGAREGDRGKVILKHARNKKHKTIQRVTLSMIEPGARLISDDHKAYRKLSHVYEHEVVNHTKSDYGTKGHTTNGMESMNSLIKKQYRGTNNHWSPKYMQNYLNEIAYRQNYWKQGHDKMENLGAFIERTCA